MTLEDLADLIRADGADTNGRIDALRAETNAALMNVRNDLSDVRGKIKEAKRDLSDVKRSFDPAATLAALRKRADTFAAEGADRRRRAS